MKDQSEAQILSGNCFICVLEVVLPSPNSGLFLKQRITAKLLTKTLTYLTTHSLSLTLSQCLNSLFPSLVSFLVSLIDQSLVIRVLSSELVDF